MKVWILCLLIGSITCGPVGKGYGSNSADTTFMQQPFSSGYWFSGGGVSSDLGSSSPLRLPQASDVPAPRDAGAGSSSSSLNVYSSNTDYAGGKAIDSGYVGFRDERYNSPEVNEYGVAYAAVQSSGYAGTTPGSGYGSAYVGESSYEFAPTPDENWSPSATSYGARDENPESVLSDMSDLEPVYSFRSRSSYQQGRAVFAQTRYTPGEPVPLFMPVSRPISKITSKQSHPAKTPTKGGS